MGVEIDWEKVGNLIPVSGQKKEKPKAAEGQGHVEGEGWAAEGSSKDLEDEEKQEGEGKTEEEQPTTEEEPELTWSDVALSIGAEIVMTCRNSVHEQLGYTCSAGIAPNKVRSDVPSFRNAPDSRRSQMLAKLCSAWKKPNAQTILRFSCIANFLKPMGFQKIRNLGGKLGDQIKEAYNAQTVGDLLDVTLPELQSKLGDDSGTWLWEIIRGLDFSEGGWSRLSSSTVD